MKPQILHMVIMEVKCSFSLILISLNIRKTNNVNNCKLLTVYNTYQLWSEITWFNFEYCIITARVAKVMFSQVSVIL